MTTDRVSCKLDPSVEEEGMFEILQGLTEEEKKALPDENMPLRHFRAEKGDVKKALKQLKETLAWRKEFQVETLRDCFHSREEAEEQPKDGTTTAAEFRDVFLEEAATGKIYVRGYDKEGRAVVYMKPGLENTHNERNNMRHLVWHMEKAIAITERNGFSKIVFVIDYEGFSLLKAPPLSTSKYTLDIMQRHYPERCERFHLVNPPFIFRAFWAAVQPFIDPHTKQKIVFATGKSGMQNLVNELGGDASRLEECAGGTGNLPEFNAETYFNLPLDKNLDEERWGYSAVEVKK